MEKIICATCGREFRTSQSLGSHKFYGHGQASEKQKRYRRFMTDQGLLQLLKTFGEGMTSLREVVSDLSKRDLELLAQIRRLDGEIAELRQDPGKTKV